MSGNSKDRLTYSGAGVDVEANLEANRRIQLDVERTFNNRVLTRAGLFAAAIGLEDLPAELEHPALTGTLGYSRGCDPAAAAVEIAEACLSRLSPGDLPLAFLDYLGAAALLPGTAADMVGALSAVLQRPPGVPLVGGETAEMPGVFRAGGWEAVGALFALHPAAAGTPQELLLSGNPAETAVVFSMDGVGTKTKLGVMSGRTSGLALDILHHSLDDLLCQGARGRAMLLYIGCHRRDPALLDPLRHSAERACRRNGLALVELAVAEKPGLYPPGEIDICAAVAGTVPRVRLLQGTAVREGDLLLGLPSSGLHTNGYSLARKALFERAGIGIGEYVAELGRTVGEALLEPHTNYAEAVLPLLDGGPAGPPDGESEAITGIAHITGGGLKENLVRILPEGLAAEIHLDRWSPPPIFELIRRCGNIPLHDPLGKGMYESFNMGIGLVLCVRPGGAAALLRRLRRSGHDALLIGEVVAGPEPQGGSRPERVRLQP